MNSLKPRAALLSSPGISHLSPVLELGGRLVAHHGVHVTVLVVATNSSPAEDQLLQSAKSANNTLVEIVQLPPVDISSLVHPNAPFGTRLAVTMRESRPNIRSAIVAMKPNLSVFIVDHFGTESFAIADEFEIPKYVFIPPNARFLALTIYAPVLDKIIVGEYVDQKEPLQIPGCKPIRPEDVLDPMPDRTDPQYPGFIRMGTNIPKCDGILVNTWEELEPTTIAALREDKILSKVVKVPIYPVGPLVKLPGHVKSELLDWLNMQPGESVIYVSFGSGGTLSAKQITEIAWGLELSQQRFIWVLRPPKESDPSSFYLLAGGGGDDVSSCLPHGFLDRIQKIGVVVPNWAPQKEILGHPSVGGFLSHCGWNSVLESITNGVPMIVWPLYAEQKLNAAMLSEDLGVAVRPKVWPTKKVVDREEIENMVRKIMEKESNAMRDRVKELQINAKKALSMGGSSYNSLAQMVGICEARWQKLQANRLEEP